jgi:hypothetical protein
MRVSPGGCGDTGRTGGSQKQFGQTDAIFAFLVSEFLAFLLGRHPSTVFIPSNLQFFARVKIVRN